MFYILYEGIESHHVQVRLCDVTHGSAAFDPVSIYVRLNK